MTPYRVHLILDPELGQQLAVLPAREPVWIVENPPNDLVIHQLWKERPGLSDLEGITRFKSYDCSSESAFLDMLSTVDLHHGAYSTKTPYSLLEVVGCSPTEDVRAALEELGFCITASSPKGFTAERLAHSA